MGNTNADIINKSAITTGTLTSGLLKPEQAKKFLKQTFETTPLSKLIRHEMRTSKTGEIDKIGVARRIIRGKTENADNGHRAGVNTSQITYATKAVRLPWEISEETLRENIEGENFEEIVADLMTAQLGVDLEDLSLNGDEDAATATAFSTSETYVAGKIVTHDDGLWMFTKQHNAGAWIGNDVIQLGSAEEKEFIKLNDGWVKQLIKGGHVLDASGGAYNGSINLDLFYKAVQQIPNKYNNGKLRWIMSPTRAQEWEKFLLNQVVEKGGAVPDSVYTSPASIPVVTCPALGNDKVLLTAPENLIVVNTYDVKIRKTKEGQEAIYKDKRFYVIHLDFDPIIEELDATAIITGLKQSVNN